ncbi:MAG: RNA polymerase factor sigma-54 [Rectinemataceae bacterium]|nr:RNA polymerase factor sigma-54 [Rectinemataceae bacterium]
MQFQRTALVAEQRQKLSPQMIQSIRLMAMPVQELKEAIQTEVEANPALEILEDRSTLSLERFRKVEEPGAGTEYDDPYSNSSDSGYSSRSSSEDDSKRMFMEGSIAKPETLQEHLLYQLRLQAIDETRRRVGETLIQNLDDEGFHKEDPYLLCPDVDRETVDRTMGLVRHLEPEGTCTADYRESLMVQANLDGVPPKGVPEILTGCLELLERGKDTEIRKRLKLSQVEFDAAVRFIKTLAPFPGRMYSAQESKYVIPDLKVKIIDGEFVIILNDVEIPVLGINPFFDKLSAEKSKDKKTNAFVRENMSQAKFFIRSIHQRNQTLLKVARSIVKHQSGFFTKGPKGLLPLTLRDVADEIGVHETTVSRIAHSKYMQTEWGIYDLRYFFTNSISGAGSQGSDFSKGGVKETIREIILAENKALSDRDIMEILAGKGIHIARRTVAKYRGELDLDSSFSRRHS